MGVKESDKILREMKNNFLQLNQMDTSHSSSINQLETLLGRILDYLNGRKKGGLPCDVVANPKNGAHNMSIITRSGRTLGNGVDNLDEDLNERKSNEQASEKCKRHDKSNEISLFLMIQVFQKPRVVEEKVENKEASQVVNSNIGWKYDCLKAINQNPFISAKA